MSTATKPKPKKPRNIMGQLAERESEVAGLLADRNQISRDLKAANDGFQALAGQRQALAHREPGLVTHTGDPNPDVSGNPIVEVDAQLAELPDIVDLQARADHAARIASRAEQSLSDWIGSNRDAIIEGLRPESELLRSDLQAKIDASQKAASAFLQHIYRYEQLTGNRSDALDHIAAITRDFQRVVPAVDQANRLGGIGTIEATSGAGI